MSDAARQVMAMISRQRQEEYFIAECLLENDKLSQLGVQPGSYIGRYQTIIGNKKKKRDNQKGMFLAIAATFGVTLAVALLKKWLSDSIDEMDRSELDSDTSSVDDSKDSLSDRVKKFVGVRDESGPSMTSQGNGVTKPVSSPEVAKISASPDAEDTKWIKTVNANEETKSSIKESASKSGVDYALLYGVLGAESNFRTDVKASTSSATGIGQFTKSTWLYLVEKLKLPYTEQDRSDPKKASHVAGLYLQEIQKTLSKTLDRKPSYGETYLGYFLGPGAAVKFLSALKKNPNQTGASLFDKAAKANPNIFYERGDQNKPKTLAQILAQIDGKVLSYAKDADPNVTSLTASNVQVDQVNSTSSSPSNDPSSGTSIAAPTAAKATMVADRIQLPNDVVTSKKSQDRAEQAAERVTNNNQKPELASSVSLDSSNQTGIPFRGKDGRIYQTNQG